MRFILIFSFCCSLCLLRPVAAAAQELNANVTVNHSKSNKRVRVFSKHSKRR